MAFDESRAVKDNESMSTDLDAIAEHVSRITIQPQNHIAPDGRQYRTWDFSIELKRKPPHHYAAGSGATLEEAIAQAVQRAGVHTAVAKGQPRP